MVSVDHEVVHPFAPIVPLDLSSQSGVKILWNILSSPGLVAIHLGLPCGTSSRARERPLPMALKLAGVPEPPPLRSEQYPLGLPGLAPWHQDRVDSANKLYELAVEIILWCWMHDIIVSIENPANSWLWLALQVLAKAHSHQAVQALSALQMVKFHACCHGSTRRKNTGWLSTPGVFDALTAECQNDHEHEPWGVQWKAGTWVFDTSSEAQYPTLLAQRAVDCLCRAFAARNLPLEKPLRLHDLSTATTGKQTKKHKPLIPEYHRTVVCSSSDPAPPGSKQLPPHFTGDGVAEEETTQLESTKRVKYGIYHSAKQFLSLAKRVRHPMDSTDHLEAVTKQAIDFNFKFPDHVVRLERRKNLLQARLMAAKLGDKECELHGSFPEPLRKVLRGKKLLLWKALLEKYEYDDMGVIPFMLEGVKLVGLHDTPPCYPPMLKPATMVLEDLQKSALWRRRAMVGKVQKSDPSHIEHLEATAADELDRGFVEGPFDSEAEVTKHLGRNDWCVVRRFVLVQGAELKLRPIDDCHEAQINSAYSVSSYLKLQDIDYVTGMALKISERVADGSTGPGREPWCGKCLDLSKAYKQMAIHPDHRHLAVVFFHDLEGKPKYLVANSLVFGASAAVYSFNRVSRSLWFLLNKMLVIPCGVFYDDFPMFSPASLAENADEAASALFDLLGWLHAKTGTKASPFKPQFQVLGCSLNLEEIATGTLVLENKPGRLDRVVSLLEQVRSAGTLTRHQGQVIHGLMRYACGFFSGKYLHQVCAEVLALCFSTTRKSSDVSSFCNYAIQMLRAAVPKRLSVNFDKRPVLIFTDGCWESNFAGIGAVIFDTATDQAYVCSGVVPDELLTLWKKAVGDHLICQIELYVMVIVRWQFRTLLHNRRSIWWVDNDSARFCVIKGLSPSPSMRALVREFYAIDAETPSFSWVERVPSLSNISDGPSRADCLEALQLLETRAVTEFIHDKNLILRISQLSCDERGKRKQSS